MTSLFDIVGDFTMWIAVQITDDQWTITDGEESTGPFTKEDARKKAGELNKTLTADDIKALWASQLECVQTHVDICLNVGMSDDGYDYLTAALELADKMTQLVYAHCGARVTFSDDDFPAAILHYGDESEHPVELANYACDGVGELFYNAGLV